METRYYLPPTQILGPSIIKKGISEKDSRKADIKFKGAPKIPCHSKELKGDFKKDRRAGGPI